MNKQVNKDVRRARRRIGIRKTLEGTPTRPRLAVYKSLKHMYVQVIDDLSGRTLCSASSRELKLDGSNPGHKSGAEAVGKSIAEKAKAAGIKEVAFDRGGFRYHGRVRALADAARKSGLKF